MGLYAEFAPEDLGYKLEFYNDKYMITVEVDYSEALRVCAETFLQLAQAIVPVDTGFLRSTLSSREDSSSVYFAATAEYAQFVEYGTFKQEAQPYFRPALEAALLAFIELADSAQAEAKEEFDLEIEMARQEEEDESGGSFLGLGAPVAAIALLIFLYPVILNLYAFTQILKPVVGDSEQHVITTGGLMNSVTQIAENLIEIIEDEGGLIW